MHLEPAETDFTVPVRHPGRATPTSDTDERPREGLPPAFKMRHGRHYVEQLMGDAPLRTVREIPIGDVEAPEGEPLDLDELQRSIQAVGILQPLLVSQHGNRFHIIAGANRYRAAVQLSLRTVPCLVYETGAHSVDALRDAAARRAAPSAPPEPAMPVLSDDPAQTRPAAGLREVTARLAFVSAVMPALDAAGADPLRWSVLTDLMKVEMERARSTAAAVEWLSSPSLSAVRESVEATDVIASVLEAVGPEARLQGVTLSLTSAVEGYRVSLDRGMVIRALIGLVQGLLTLSPAGSTLRIEASGTAVRPALIVAVTLDGIDLDAAAAERFFDADFAGHPGGASSSIVLSGVARAARAHGGRAHARAHDGACTATFVIPKPLADA